MTEVKGQAYHYYVEYPPADLIPHKIFEHFLTRANVREYKQRQCRQDAVSTNLPLKS